MMGRNWIRKYKFTAGPPGGIGFSTGDLRISFDVKKTDEEAQNTATIDIYNLNDMHVNMLCEKDCYVKLEAGYEQSELVTIFEGNVTYGDSEMDGADRKTTLECSDGRAKTRDTYSSTSYDGSTDSKTVIQDAADEMGIEVEFAEDCEFGNMPNGYSFVGQTTDMLTKACDVSGLSWYIDNGKLKIKKYKGTMNKLGYVLSANTGLIGVPKKIVESGDSEQDKKVTGYEVEYFLNANIKVGDYVNLVSKDVQGYFRVESLTISGDNFAGDWTCKATLKDEKEMP